MECSFSSVLAAVYFSSRVHMRADTAPISVAGVTGNVGRETNKNEPWWHRMTNRLTE